MILLLQRDLGLPCLSDSRTLRLSLPMRCLPVRVGVSISLRRRVRVGRRWRQHVPVRWMARELLAVHPGLPDLMRMLAVGLL